MAWQVAACSPCTPRLDSCIVYQHPEIGLQVVMPFANAYHPRAASMTARSMFICIIASTHAARAVPDRIGDHFVRAIGVICQLVPTSPCTNRTRVPARRSRRSRPSSDPSAWFSVATWKENASLCLNIGSPLSPKHPSP